MGPFGSSGSSLHAKTFAVDGQRVFVGSFNFDPRSATLNTELGFVIDSPTLAGRIADAFKNELPKVAYRVCLDDKGDLYWLEQRNGETIRHDTEPGTTAWKRFSVWFVSLLPLEPLL
ncbi:cardiolipin synthetase [compost metagenome]